MPSFFRTIHLRPAPVTVRGGFQPAGLGGPAKPRLTNY